MFNRTLPILESAFHRLESRIDSPSLTKVGKHQVFRYEKKSIQAAAIQKLARVISGLYAVQVLLNAGLYQETGALFRMLDEFSEDVTFLSLGILLKHETKLHQDYLTWFYQEEFDIPDNPLASAQKRPTIKRARIAAAIAEMEATIAKSAGGKTLNPSDTQNLLRTLGQTYSGYVHGASVHILELYGDVPPHYHLSGMLGTVREVEFLADSMNYLYRGLLAVMSVSMAFDDRALTESLYVVRDEFEKSQKVLMSGNIVNAVRDLKKGAGK